MSRIDEAQNESGMLPYLLKLRGAGGKSPLQVLPKHALYGFLGGMMTIGALAYMTEATNSLWLMAPFGASCVLVFAVWDSPLSQPRNVIGGHLLATLVSLILSHLFGNGSWVMAVGVGLAIGLMMLTKTTHPPAGADPLVIIMAQPDWSFLFNPVLTGALVIVIAAVLLNNMDSERHYPKFWY